MLRYFPAPDVVCVHRKRDYFIAGFTFFCVAVSLVIDAHASLTVQNILGVIAWIFLIGLLVGENKEIRIQVAIAVAFATAGEHFASVYMGGYTYRFENVPLYVPPGHGMVYLTAVALARSGFFLRYARKIAAFVVIVCGLWSLWGISGLPEQGDQVGAILFCVFLIYLFKGRSPMVYLAALSNLNHSLNLFIAFRTMGAPPIATASTRQYHAATPLGGFPWDSPNMGSSFAQYHVPAAVPINSSQVVIKKAAK